LADAYEQVGNVQAAQTERTRAEELKRKAGS